ncbi:MAG: type II toxin-antitoxin system VapC family toxin [Nitrospira sp.]|nr:type II toxin-antitoxin system VapC family toxin [Nitrospira sp.]MCY4132050.1 type II toxin-antitoxin system VapC family toxin [Nitrospira sp.]
MFYVVVATASHAVALALSSRQLTNAVILNEVPVLEPDSTSILRLARTHGLTAYDAMYLELSIRQQRPLATLDRRLSVAAQSEGVRLTA